MAHEFNDYLKKNSNFFPYSYKKILSEIPRQNTFAHKIAAMAYTTCISSKTLILEN